MRKRDFLRLWTQLHGYFPHIDFTEERAETDFLRYVRNIEENRGQVLVHNEENFETAVNNLKMLADLPTDEADDDEEVKEDEQNESTLTSDFEIERAKLIAVLAPSPPNPLDLPSTSQQISPVEKNLPQTCATSASPVLNTTKPEELSEIVAKKSDEQMDSVGELTQNNSFNMQKQNLSSDSNSASIRSISKKPKPRRESVREAVANISTETARSSETQPALSIPTMMSEFATDCETNSVIEETSCRRKNIYRKKTNKKIKSGTEIPIPKKAPVKPKKIDIPEVVQEENETNYRGRLRIRKPKNTVSNEATSKKNGKQAHSGEKPINLKTCQKPTEPSSLPTCQIPVDLTIACNNTASRVEFLYCENLNISILDNNNYLSDSVLNGHDPMFNGHVGSEQLTNEDESNFVDERSSSTKTDFAEQANIASNSIRDETDKIFNEKELEYKDDCLNNLLTSDLFNQVNDTVANMNYIIADELTYTDFRYDEQSKPAVEDNAAMELEENNLAEDKSEEEDHQFEKEKKVEKSNSSNDIFNFEATNNSETLEDEIGSNENNVDNDETVGNELDSPLDINIYTVAKSYAVRNNVAKSKSSKDKVLITDQFSIENHVSAVVEEKSHINSLLQDENNSDQSLFVDNYSFKSTEVSLKNYETNYEEDKDKLNNVSINISNGAVETKTNTPSKFIDSMVKNTVEGNKNTVKKSDGTLSKLNTTDSISSSSQVASINNCKTKIESFKIPSIEIIDCVTLTSKVPLSSIITDVTKSNQRNLKQKPKCRTKIVTTSSTKSVSRKNLNTSILENNNYLSDSVPCDHDPASNGNLGSNQLTNEDESNFVIERSSSTKTYSTEQESTAPHLLTTEHINKVNDPLATMNNIIADVEINSSESKENQKAVEEEETIGNKKIKINYSVENISDEKAKSSKVSLENYETNSDDKDKLNNVGRNISNDVVETNTTTTSKVMDPMMKNMDEEILDYDPYENDDDTLSIIASCDSSDDEFCSEDATKTNFSSKVNENMTNIFNEFKASNSLKRTGNINTVDKSDGIASFKKPKLNTADSISSSSQVALISNSKKKIEPLKIPKINIVDSVTPTSKVPLSSIITDVTKSNKQNTKCSTKIVKTTTTNDVSLNPMNRVKLRTPLSSSKNSSNNIGNNDLIFDRSTQQNCTIVNECQLLQNNSPNYCNTLNNNDPIAANINERVNVNTNFTRGSDFNEDLFKGRYHSPNITNIVNKSNSLFGQSTLLNGEGRIINQPNQYKRQTYVSNNNINITNANESTPNSRGAQIDKCRLVEVNAPINQIFVPPNYTKRPPQHQLPNIQKPYVPCNFYTMCSSTFGINCYRYINGRCASTEICGKSHELKNHGELQHKLFQLKPTELIHAYIVMRSSKILFQKFFMCFVNIYACRKETEKLIGILRDIRLYPDYATEFIKPLQDAVQQCGLDKIAACKEIVKRLLHPSVGPRLLDSLVVLIMRNQWEMFMNELCQIAQFKRYNFPQEVLLFMITDSLRQVNREMVAQVLYFSTFIAPRLVDLETSVLLESLCTIITHTKNQQQQNFMDAKIFLGAKFYRSC